MSQQGFDRAIALHQASCFLEALDIYETLPESEAVLYNTIRVLWKLQRLDEALAKAKKAQTLYPDSELLTILLSDLWVACGEHQQALFVLQTFHDSHRKSAEVLHKWAKLLFTLKQFEEAEKRFLQARTRAPNDAEIHFNLAALYGTLQRPREAVEVYRRATELKPDWALAYCRLADNLLHISHTKEAYKACQKALQLDPNLGDPYATLGVCHRNLAQHAQAIECFRKAIHLNPRELCHVDNLLYSYQFSGTFSPSYVFREHRKWGQEWQKNFRPYTQHQNKKDPHKTLTVGLVSADFHRHSVAYFLEPLLRCCDSHKLRFILYYNACLQDDITEQLSRYAEKLVWIYRQSPHETFTQILSDRVDLLIDLGGHTANNSLEVFARCPAPVQLSYLGYPCTTGIPTIHYRITDSFTDPPECDRWHTETPLRMQRLSLCYSPLGKTPSVSPAPYREKGYVTFGSFNNVKKLNDRVLDTWAAILHRVPSSKLLLKSRTLDTPEVRESYEEMFHKRGIHSDRLELLEGRRDRQEHLSLYSHMDLAFDSFPYNGTTTSCEALWMGVPVLALEGKSYVSRMGSALLRTLKLEELITQSEEAYIEKAVALATDPEQLDIWRHCLRETMRISPLCQEESFAREFEDLLRYAWQQYCKEQSPSSIFS